MKSTHQNLRNFKFWLIVALVTLAWVVPILWLHSQNSRLLASWHGFLHSGIATRYLTDSAFPPENPFYAGEIIPYYCFYHYVGYLAAQAFRIDLLHAFQGFSLTGLFIVILFGALTGIKTFKSLAVGLLIGYFALAGQNPFGPVIAAAKHLVKDVPLIENFSREDPVETVFVTDKQADDWMTQPLLPDLYIGSNWKHGQNFVWFYDISSRTVAISLLMVLLFLVLVPRQSLVVKFFAMLTAFLMTAFNPLIGLAASGSLLGGTVLAPFFPMRGISFRKYLVDIKTPLFVIALFCLLGSLLSFPTFQHLLQQNHKTVTFSHPISYVLLKLAATVANSIVLVPLALFGWKFSGEKSRAKIKPLAISGLLLLGAVPVFSILPGNEHNLSNTAQFFLAVPAAVAVPLLGKQIHHISDRFTFLKGINWQLRLPVLAVLTFLPTTLCTFFSYTGRPAIPLITKGQQLLRAPVEGTLQQFYNWVSTTTPPDAVFIIDPDRAVKMSGNVSELPAFTNRTLFRDKDTYLTTPYKDSQLRVEIAKRLTRGIALSETQTQYLMNLGRPLYLLSYDARKTEVLEHLATRYGEPDFHQDFIAVFQLNLHLNRK